MDLTSPALRACSDSETALSLGLNFSRKGKPRWKFVASMLLDFIDLS